MCAKARSSSTTNLLSNEKLIPSQKKHYRGPRESISASSIDLGKHKDEFSHATPLLSEIFKNRSNSRTKRANNKKIINQ